jgi:precorrin-2 dehydrogenase / sirohydrochlorin ferrochelatase
MTNYFPSFLNLDYKKVVIVGGGHVAYQKLMALLPTKATIVIVCPVVQESIVPLLKKANITWRQKEFEPKDLDDASLIFAVTNSEAVNDTVEEATQHWQLLSRADAQGRIDFINPAVVRRGDFVVAISTSGASPSLARKIKGELEAQFDESYAQYVDFLQQARDMVKTSSKNSEERKIVLQKLLDPKLLEWIQQGDNNRCHQYLQQLLSGEQLS